MSDTEAGAVEEGVYQSSNDESFTVEKVHCTVRGKRDNQVNNLIYHFCI